MAFCTKQSMMESALASPPSRTCHFETAFASVTQNIVGVGYKPVLYVGEQIVHGTNHYIVCEARGVYPGARPYATVVCVNICDGSASLVSVTPINASAGTKTATGMFGYAFTWLQSPH